MKLTKEKKAVTVTHTEATLDLTIEEFRELNQLMPGDGTNDRLGYLDLIAFNGLSHGIATVRVTVAGKAPPELELAGLEL